MNAKAKDQTKFEGIEESALFYAQSRDELRKAVTAMQDEIRAVGENHRAAILAALDQAVNARSALAVLVTDNVALFAKPKTRQMHGIKVGFQKQPGKIVIDNVTKVIARIRDKLKDKASGLIKTKETIIKAALKALSVPELSAIGCKVTDVGEQLVIQAVDSDIERLIEAIASEDTMPGEMLAKAKGI